MSSSQWGSMYSMMLMHVAGGPSTRISTGTLSRPQDVHLGVLAGCWGEVQGTSTPVCPPAR
eukprot:6131866-Pyramimonas_sp.AAC.1